MTSADTLPRSAAADPLPRPARRALVAMYAGLALTVLAALAVVVGSADLSRHLHGIYDPWIGPAKADESQSVLVTYLLAVGVLGVASWLLLARAIKRRKGWARPAATVVFVLASGIAGTNLLMQEYEKTILPTQLGIAGVLPCLAGLVAVVLLWLREPAPVTPTR